MNLFRRSLRWLSPLIRAIALFSSRDDAFTPLGSDAALAKRATLRLFIRLRHPQTAQRDVPTISRGFSSLIFNRLQQFRRLGLVLGFVAVILSLNTVLRAAEPPLPSTQSNAVATGPIPDVRTNTASADTQSPTTAVEPAPGATNSAYVLDDTHKLAIGDRLSFRILEDEVDPKDVPVPYFVTDSGDLEVPYIGRVPAEGKTCRQLALEIKAALEKDYYYHATVILAVDVMAKSHGRVYLVGAVRLPGPVELPGDEVVTLSKAILRAGGFTDYADQRHVKVTRKGASGKAAAANNAMPKEDLAEVAKADAAAAKDDKTTFIVDVGEIFDKGKIETDLTLEPGDLIYVPERLIRF